VDEYYRTGTASAHPTEHPDPADQWHAAAQQAGTRQTGGMPDTAQAHHPATVTPLSGDLSG